MQQWGRVRSRVESDIMRKKEHRDGASKFEKARGFVRTDWKSKNFNPNDDPCMADSSTDEDELEQDEAQDKVDLIVDTTNQHISSKLGSETQLKLLKEIQAYNSALPKKRRIKDKLDEQCV